MPASLQACQASADAQAIAYAHQQASLNRTCLSDLDDVLCVGLQANQDVNVTGNHPPYTFSVSSGTLPDGVDLVPGGPKYASLFGSYDTPGDYTFTIMAVGADGNFVQKTYVIHVVGITTDTCTDGTVGTAYSFTIPYAGTPPPVTFVLAGTLPPGLTLDNTTGEISGTPTTAGTYNFDVMLVGSQSCLGNLTMTVNTPVALTFRYWTLNETGMSNRVDSVNGDVLVVTSTGLDLDAQPGLFGNALHLDNLNPVGVNKTVGLASSGGDTPLNTTGLGFSIAGWFKIVSLTADFAQVFMELDDSMTSDYITLSLTCGAGTASAIKAQDRVGTSLNVPVAPAFPTGSWVFFHLFWDATAQQAGYSINNGAPTMIGSGLVLGTFDNYYFGFGCFSNAPTLSSEVLYDEVLVLFDANLTATQLAYLYNSGSGRTWPITLP